MTWIKVQADASGDEYRSAGDGKREMPTFLYRCPNTGLRVQGWIADKPIDQIDESYEAVACLVCARIHLADPKTGKVLGEHDDDIGCRPTHASRKHRGT